MSYTKRQFVIKAFGKIGLASYVYDLSPDQLQAAAEELDAMMAEWNGRGIRLGYPLSGTPGAVSLDDLSGVPDAANFAIFANLALRIAPNFGKNAPPELKVAAKDAYNVLLARATFPEETQMKVMPRGAGNKRRGNEDVPFSQMPVAPLTAGADSDLDFNT